MAQHTISASAGINAPAERIYRVIADYRDGHPHMLPRPPFGVLTVEQGGVGEGTIISFTLRLLGRTQQFRAAIAEPEPGRVLVERNLDGGATTTFTVEPRPDGLTSLVTIATTTTVRNGFAGALESWMTTRLLRPIYERELVQLAAFVAGKPAGQE